MLQYELEYDREETGLLKEIRLLEDEGEAILMGIEADKIRIRNKYREKVKQLRDLSKFKCGICGDGGNDLHFVTCDKCRVSLCSDCRSECTMQHESYYCDECEERSKCVKCEKAVCDDCDWYTCNGCQRFLCGKCGENSGWCDEECRLFEY